jgi:hypothetical protein
MSENQNSGEPNSSAGEKKQSDVRYVPVEVGQLHDYSADDKVNLIDLVKILWEGKRIIIAATILFTFIGMFVYLFGERQYTSDAIMLEEQRQTQLPNNRLLQQFGGGVIDMQSEGIPSRLYPTIIESADFMLGVIEQEVEFESLGMAITPKKYFYEYYRPPLTERTSDFITDYTIKLPITLYRGVRGLFSRTGDDLPIDQIATEADTRFLSLDREQRRAIRMMRERIDLDLSGGLAKFTVDMPDAKAAAEINLIVIEQIQEYVIDYRLQKYRQNLEFVQKQKEDARERYEEAQLQLAQFRDRNVNINTAVQRIQQEDLENRRNITFNVYNNLAQDLEQTRTRLQEETPVFNVLQNQVCHTEHPVDLT